jgi:uncharacterized protein (UPF0335 family)
VKQFEQKITLLEKTNQISEKNIRESYESANSQKYQNLEQQHLTLQKELVDTKNLRSKLECEKNLSSHVYQENIKLKEQLETCENVINRLQREITNLKKDLKDETLDNQTLKEIVSVLNSDRTERNERKKANQ